MTVDEMKQWIDGASYEQLLSKWRFARAGDPFFQPPVGDYYQERISAKKKEVGDVEAVAASKRIGW